MSTALSRVTVIAAHRHLDVRLPSDEPISSLMPQILDLMNEPASAGTSAGTTTGLLTSSVLTTSVGVTLESSLTLRQAGISDGSMLYLRDERDVPSAPDVYDVPSFTAESTERLPALWADKLRSIGLSTVAGLLMAAASSSFVVVLRGTGNRDAALIGIAIAAALMLLGAIAGRARSIPAGLALVSAGLATAAATSFIVTPFATGALLLSAALVLALAASGVATAKYIPFLSSAGLLLTLGGLWALLGFSTRDQPLSAGITGIVAIFALGVAPRLATILTGLSGLDDDQRQGKRITRNTTLDAVHAAHATLTGWTLTAAVIAGAAVVVVATAKNRPVWAVLLAVALLGALTFRGLALPLLAQRAGVYVAAAGACWGATLVFVQASKQPLWLVVAAALAVLVLVACMVRVREQTAARLRVIASRLELLCVLATIPLVLGLSGAYTQLGQTFG
ncbi:type VII secretion integral membrane protein EccD [Paenarthrobacter nitroguajacolicus]|uniref:type VII secretion integral membrane protein EccD n=1 Tax=Paenarthrobacter nitroguajacolicus TaxID=211146 RepID=UPI000A454E48|nr:type VII secretion integral membrane protein EccD [Paenarthrobacter nitroguajacolicus]